MGKEQNFTEIFNKYRGKSLKIVAHFYDGQKWALTKTIFYLALQNSPTWVLPIVTANVINIVTYKEAHNLYELWINAAVLLVFLLQNIFSTYSVAVIYDKLVRTIEFKLRSCLIEKLQDLSIAFHKHEGSGKLLSKVIRDSENIETLLSQMFRQLFSIITQMIVAIIVTIKNSPLVLLFFAAFIPIEIIAVRALKKKIKDRNNKFRNEVEEMQSSVSEMLELIPVTRAHGLKDVEIEKMEQHFSTVKDVGYSLDKTNWLFNASIWVIMQVSQLTCLVFTGMLAYKGKITVGEVMLYQTYFNQLVNCINSFINMYPQIAKGLESVNSVGEILYNDNVETNNSILPIPNMQGKIQFVDVDFKYPESKKMVLHNFNLTINAGESLAFVGGSGAGKSTLLNLIIGFDKPLSGKILIDGINMLNLDLNEYRHQIAVVPQNTILFSGTIRDNITYGISNVTDDMIEKVIADVGLDDLIDNLPKGIYTVLGEHGGTLSGGQRQRISIARALLRKPKIVIFDEATSALDSVSEKKVQMAVENMMKQCTTLLVAHRLSTIKNADKIAFVKNGTITELGTYEELIAKQGDFFNLKKLQD